MLTLLLLALSPARAETADEVVAKARAANRVDSAVESVRMTIVSKSGSERVRELELKSRRDGEVVKTYLKLTSPSDVAGTQLLLVDNPGKVDEQLLYLPAYKRVNHISGSARKGAFVGSDFSYEDLEIREAAEGVHTLAEDGADAWVIETTPGEGSQYSKIRAHIGKADLVARKVEFFDPEGTLVKVLEVKRTVVDGGVTLPVETEMSNVVKGTRTRLEITAHQLNVGQDVLPDATFTSAFLEQGG